jgi:acyl transferase domain-containing protein
VTDDPGLEVRPLDIAVVGMSGRFPGARDIADYWRLLAEGREAAADLSPDQLVANGAHPDLVNLPDYVRHVPVLDGIDEFDAPFFGFSPDHARLTDPQQRLFLEQSWHALEDAGHDPRRFDGLVGVFAGSDVSTYMFSNLLGNLAAVGTLDPLQFGLANDKDSLTTRVGYLLDLRGPCYTVQSYCSTSLVAVCAAATSLVHGECDMALAGGVSVAVPQGAGYLYQDNGMNSRDGRCRAFDADSDGTPMGSGLGVVVLRRLDEALADGDHIRAVLRGWAVNNDGGLKVGYTAPSVQGQSAAISDALVVADLSPGDIDYVETHGTGTPLGDSVELSALQRVFTPATPCLIGSVKTNIGHLNHASGVTGLIKTILSLEHGTIPPTLHFATPNPQLEETGALSVVTESLPWPDRGRPRRAGVSSFGIGGTNAHVIVEQAPVPPPRPASTRTRHLLVWSGRTERALSELTGALGEYLAAPDGPALGDVAFTMQAGRAAFEHRRFLVAESRPAAAAALADPARGAIRTMVQPVTDRPVGLLIAGVGEQYQGLATRLYATEPAFRERLDRSRAALHDLTGLDPVAEFLAERAAPATGGDLDLRALIRRGAPDQGERASSAHQTSTLQPALFVIWHALAETLREWGIRPAVLLGYSLGEYVAACLSGVLSFDDALRLVTYRAELISRAEPGAMAAIALGEEAARAAIAEAGLPLDIAGVNAPAITVVAGPGDAVDQLCRAMSGRDVPTRLLDTSHAFHSRMLDGLAGDLTAWASEHVTPHEPAIPYLSNVTGAIITADEATDPGYWARHMCSAVRFADAAAVMLARGDLALLEVGPGSSLGGMIRSHPGCLPARWPSIIATLPAAADPRPADAVLAEAVGQLWLNGVPADFASYHRRHGSRRVPAPRYPFSRERHWIAPAAPATADSVATATGPSPAAQPAAAVLPASRDADTVASRTWLRAPVWQPAPATAGPAPGHVLLFADEQGIAAELEPMLAADGTTVTVVRRGAELAEEAGRWLADPLSAADHADVVRALPEARHVVVDLWPADAADQAGGRALAFASTAAVAHAVGSSGADVSRLMIVTAGAEAVLDEDVPSPEAALATGPALAVGQEYPHLAAQRIDLPGGSNPPGAGVAGWARACALALRTEIQAASPDALVAYRDGTRYTRSFERRMPADPVPPAARPGGVYLIAGGRGAIGLLLAGHLSRQGAAAVVLVGRSQFPGRDQWDDVAADSPAGRVIGGIRAAESHGAAIAVERADISDPDAVTELIASVKERFGRLDGVIHAAAATEPEAFSSLATVTMNSASLHFAPKVDGALAFEQALAGERLDYCLLFSSISAVLGGLGFAAYASANAFLDAIVYRNRNAGRRWLAVNWDTWEHTAQGLNANGLGEAQAQNSFSVAEGLALFDAALDVGAGRVVAGTGDLDARIRMWSSPAETEAGEPPPAAARRSRPELGQEYVPPASALERQLERVWAETLGIDGVGSRDNFFDLGGTSLTGLQLLRKIRKEVGVPIPAVALFEAPTIASLAEYVAPRLAQRPQPGPAQPNPAQPDPAQPSPAQADQARTPPAAAGGPEHAAGNGHVPAAPAALDQLASAAPGTASIGAPAAGPPAELAGGIAIIGMAGRFPGARSPDELWRKIVNGDELITFFSDSELIAAGVPPTDLAMDNYVKARPVVDDIAGFDAAFFGYSPMEAMITDPQQRIFLECSWEALEHAGYGVPGNRGRVGVFAGTGLSTYLLWGRLNALSDSPANTYQVIAGNDKDALATVASYRLDLTGPSVTVQTFCSTSLVAVHLACRSLQSGECELALAGGVSIQVPNRIGYHWEPGGLGSSDGHLRVFDARADGTLFGDGSAMVVLKPLAAALRDGDTVYAVIRGSAVVNDGARRVGYTAPGLLGQARVVSEALADAKVSAADITFVEAHATATELGDPIEVTALARAFDTTKRQYCALTSIKANVGHLDRAAGATGLIKTALALRHRLLPPNIHYETPNPEIDFANSPFYVNTELRPLRPEPGRPLIAGVSSMGMGGTNAHAIVQEAPPLPPRPGIPPRSRRMSVVPLSARSASAADTACANLAGHLAANPDADLRDVAWTLQVGRQRFRHRRAAVVPSAAEAARALAAAGSAASPLLARADMMQDRHVVFVFDGGAPAGGMLAELSAREPAVSRALAAVREAVADLAGTDVVAALTSAEDAGIAFPPGVTADLASFVVSWALATLAWSWGIHPDAVLGFGAGEIAAACAAGVLTPEHAAEAVAERARLTAPMERGPGPGSAAGEAARRAAGESLADWLATNVILSAPRTRFVSATRGGLRPDAPGFWREHIMMGDLTAAAAGADEAMRAAAAGEDVAFLVFDTADLRAVQATAERACPASVVVATTSAARQRPDDTAVTEALAELWLAGVAIDWAAVARDTARGKPWRHRRIPLPTYPFERSDYWLPDAASDPAAAAADAVPAGTVPAGEGDDPLARLAATADWVHLPLWRPGALPRGGPVGEHMLVFTDDSVPAAFLDELLTLMAPASARRVTPGDAFAAVGDGWTIRPGSAQDMAALLAEAGRQAPPQRVLYLWTSASEAGGLADETRRGFWTLLELAKAMADAGYDEWQLDIVTAGSCQVLPGDRVIPSRALSTGPARVIPVEYPRVRTRLVDIAPHEDGAARRLARELSAPRGAAPVTFSALRGATRWTLEYQRPPEPDEDAVAAAFTRDGAYLVTGGLGGIGLAMAERLARDYQARLALVSRTGLPPRQQWPGLLAAPGTDAETRRRIQGVQAVEAYGHEVEVISCDLGEPQDVSAAVRRVTQRFGRLNGVVHAAGLPGVGLMQFKEQAAAERVLAAKVAGTVALEQAVAGLDLDVLVLFSSITSVTGGGPGQVDYCAANAFLDAYAHDAARRGVARRVLAIGWSEWTWNAWTGGLDGYDDAQQRFFEENRAKFGIRFEEGWQALRLAVAADYPHLVVSTQDFTALVRYSELFNLDLVRGLSGVREGTRFPRPELSVPYVEPRTETEAKLAAIWAEALGMERVGVLDRFFELGGNSLIGMDVVARTRRELGLAQLPPHALYEAPTVAALAAYVTGDGDTAGAGNGTGGDDAGRGYRAARRQAILERSTARTDSGAC